jgi:hypothetical protein
MLPISPWDRLMTWEPYNASRLDSARLSSVQEKIPERENAQARDQAAGGRHQQPLQQFAPISDPKNRGRPPPLRDTVGTNLSRILGEENLTNMIEKPHIAENAERDQAGVERLSYHTPKFVSLGTIQTLVQSGPGQGGDGGVMDFNGDGTGSAPPI